MNPKLLAFLKKHTAFNEDVLEEIMSAMQVETYKKGALLLSQGDISSKCYVVLEGCIRQYTIGEDGKETTTSNSSIMNHPRISIWKRLKD